MELMVDDDKAVDDLWALAVREENEGQRVWGAGRVLRLFHGTSWENACKIQREGFVPSSAGCLGPGVYLGREDKARRFALDRDRLKVSQGGLVAVLVQIKNLKFSVKGDDVHGTWRYEGFDYDACRTEYTSASEHMEWVILSPEQRSLQ